MNSLRIGIRTKRIIGFIFHIKETMDDVADRMIEDWYSADEIMNVTWMDEDELAERYLENWYWIRDTADELWMDEGELLDQHWDDYDYE